MGTFVLILNRMDEQIATNKMIFDRLQKRESRLENIVKNNSAGRRKKDKLSKNCNLECQWAITKKHELEAFLWNEKIYICLISETHFTRQSYIKICGYTNYHSTYPSNTARGETFVIIKDSIQHTEDLKIELKVMGLE